LIGCTVFSAKSEQESCQDASILPAQLCYLATALSPSALHQQQIERSLQNKQHSTNVHHFCTPMSSLSCAFAGWLSPKSIGIAAFMANVVLRIPFFRQWQATKRAS